MNNMPYFNQNNYMPNNPIEIEFERLNNRTNRLERQVKILENKLNKLEVIEAKPLNIQEDNSNMYML